MAGQTHSNLKNQSLGFAYHEYTRTELDINKGTHVVAIPAGKTPFKLGLNIAVSGKGSDGNSCSTTITQQFTRSDDFYPSAELLYPVTLYRTRTNTNHFQYRHLQPKVYS
ncbi:MAG: hypothetical protein CM1200mP37_2550 [Chloroflexota bacterium]|nr:MAG: hypothetical protein CM1200mP37_2550 [Chloroflexota bacterium]